MSESTTSTPPTDDKPKKRHAGGELIIPVSGILFAIYYFSTIIDTPWTAQVSAFFVGAVLIGLIGIFFIKVAVEVVRGDADLRLDAVLAPNDFIPKRLALLALTVGYIVVVHYAGFTLTTFAFLALSMLLLSNGRRKRFILSLSAVLAFAGWALFILAFHTRFPAGPFERLMEGLL
jgi:tripartite tricarboxylate transporter TctB family protein